MRNSLAVWTGCCLGVAVGLIVPARVSAQQGYDSLQAGQDAYQAAEGQRRAAIDQQRQLGEEIRADNTGAYPGYARSVTGPYAYGYPSRWYGYMSGPNWAYRQGMRYGYPPMFQCWPRVPGDICGYPYYGCWRQPIGYEHAATGPNGYVYRPLYGQPPQNGPAAGQPQVSKPSLAPQRPGASAGKPPVPPEPAPPEPLPTPPSQPAAREF